MQQFASRKFKYVNYRNEESNRGFTLTYHSV